MSGCPAGGFFFFFIHIYVVLCCCPLSDVCVYMDLDIISIFIWFFAGYGKTKGKRSVFFWCVLWLVFFVLDFISVLRYVTFVGHECVECEFLMCDGNNRPYHNLCFDGPCVCCIEMWSCIACMISMVRLSVVFHSSYLIFLIGDGVPHW